MSGLDGVYARAGGFIALEAPPLDVLRLQTLLRERDATALLEGFAALQDEAGALENWRREDADPETATLRALAALDALGLLDHPVPEAAVGYLVGLQHEDGGWGEPSAPDEARIERTGAIAGFLAKSPFARPSVLGRAERFLLERWAVWRVQGPTYAPIFAYVHLLAAFSADANDEAGDETLQWCGRELERGFRLQAFDPVSVARVFCRARARALPGAEIDCGELVAAIVTAQEADGGWSAGPGDDRIDATLEAVEALLRLG